MSIKNLEIENEIKEVDYTDSTNIYRRKLIIKLSIIFASLIIIFISRIFDKYLPFDIIAGSVVFLILLSIVVLVTIGSTIFVILSEYTKETQSTYKLHKRLLGLFDLLSVIPIFIAIVSFSNAFLISPATVIGESMEPTYYEGQDIMMWHLNNKYERFDVIVLETLGNDFYIKRIIGLPGETVLIDNNKLYINGDLIEQKFLENDDGSITVNTLCPNVPVTTCIFSVPDGSYFVMGDNREHSLDSRSNILSNITEEQIYGKVVIKFNNIFRDVLN